MVGYETIELKSRPDGRLDIAALRADGQRRRPRGLMVTNPNTLGLFESEIEEAARILHDVDGLVYMDGANLNAMLGLARPGDMGADIVHINLHKTFSTPHGGGGTGRRAGRRQREARAVPSDSDRRGEGRDVLPGRGPAAQSSGAFIPIYGNVGIILRAFAYLRSIGSDGLSRVSRGAIVNANYLHEEDRGRLSGRLSRERACTSSSSRAPG